MAMLLAPAAVLAECTVNTPCCCVVSGGSPLQNFDVLDNGDSCLNQGWTLQEGLSCAELESVRRANCSASKPCCCVNTSGEDYAYDAVQSEAAAFQCIQNSNSKIFFSPYSCLDEESNQGGQTDATDFLNSSDSSKTPGATPGLPDLKKTQELAAKNLNPIGINAPSDLISRGINLLMAFIGSIALILYIVSGFIWMSAGGNADKVTQAKGIMVWTTLGVIAMAASYMILKAILTRVG